MSVDTRTLENFIGGRWVPASTDETIDDVNPADPGDVLARVPLSTSERRRSGRRRGVRRLPSLAGDVAGSSGSDPHPGVPPARGAPGGARPPPHARAGEDARRGTRRAAACDPVLGLDGPPGRLHPGCHRAHRERPHHGAHPEGAARRHQPDHALELPPQHSGLEARFGARLREHRRPQAGAADAAVRGGARRDAGRGWGSGRRRQPRPRLRPDGRRHDS